MTKLQDEIPSDPSIEYIGTQLFTTQYRLELEKHLDSAAQTIVLEMVQESQLDTSKKDQLRANLQKQAKHTIQGMIADMSSLRVLRMFAFTIKTLLARLYHRGIHVDDEEVSNVNRYINQLREIAKDANERNVSLVFMPCHKSHIDYLVVSYVLYRMGIALPHIAAGDNLNMPFIGWILRHNGAFFIRREWGGDKLYIAIMKEYINFLLNKGFNIEAFVEGTRSRTGKLLQPKFGFLKLILESLLIHPDRDAIIVPVNVAYDKVIETPSYVNELLGTPKQKESIGQLLSSINLLQLKWGRIDVRFGRAFSMREFIQNISQSGKLDAKTISTSKNAQILQFLGYKILAEINQIAVIMPTALVGTVLLTLRGRGVGRNELMRRVTWLKGEILARGGKTAEGKTSTDEIVDRAIEVLDDLVGQKFDILERVYYPLKRFELSYYRNQVIHLFVPEAVVSVAMYSTIKAGGTIRAQRIPIFPNLSKDVTFLSKLLKLEFVFDSGGLHRNLDATIDRLISANVVVVGKDEDLPADRDLWITLSTEERRTGRETFDFYCFMLWPFVESYWLCAVSLYTILPNKQTNPGELYWTDIKVFSDRSQVFGDISYFESVNKETIANAITRLQQMNIIHLYKGQEPPAKSHFQPSIHKTNSSSTWIALSLDWVPADELPAAGLDEVIDTVDRNSNGSWFGPLARQKSIYHTNDEETSDIEALHRYSRPKSITVKETEIDLGFNEWSQHRPKGKLWEFCENIGKFRREGKNRRDTSTVAIRVLRLAQFASQWNGTGKKSKTKSKL